MSCTCSINKYTYIYIYVYIYIYICIYNTYPLPMDLPSFRNPPDLAVCSAFWGLGKTTTKGSFQRPSPNSRIKLQPVWIYVCLISKKGFGQKKTAEQKTTATVDGCENPIFAPLANPWLKPFVGIDREKPILLGFARRVGCRNQPQLCLSQLTRTGANEPQVEAKRAKQAKADK